MNYPLAGNATGEAAVHFPNRRYPVTIRSVAVRLDDRCCDVTLTDGSKCHVSFDITWHSSSEHTIAFGATIQHLSVRLHQPSGEVSAHLAERISTVVRAAEIKAAARMVRLAKL